MAFLSFLSASIAQPEGMWEALILKVFSFVSNYGWRIVLFTVLLKLLLSPLDIYQRYMARKNQKITERLKPQLEKLRKQYPDKTEFAQKQAQLNKKEGISVWSSCLPAIVTLVIFFTLFSGLQSVSSYMNFRDYHNLYTTYNVEYNIAEGEGATEEEAVARAQDAVYNEYQSQKTSFLWIKNVWSPDVPWKKETPDWETFQANCGKYNPASSTGCGCGGCEDCNDDKKWENKTGLPDAEVTQMMQKDTYNRVMGKLLAAENNEANGYLVLPILAMALSIAQQILTQRMQKKSGQTNEAMGGGMMKAMIFMMPLMIGYFALSYTSAFTLYLVVQYGISLLITLVSNLIVFSIDKREQRKLETQVIKYGRPDPNDKKDD